MTALIPDPMDRPGPDADLSEWVRDTVRRVLRQPGPPHDWQEIQNEARRENAARFTEFCIQKNFAALDLIFDARHGNVSEDLIHRTRGYTRDEREVCDYEV